MSLFHLLFVKNGKKWLLSHGFLSFLFQVSIFSFYPFYSFQRVKVYVICKIL